MDRAIRVSLLSILSVSLVLIAARVPTAFAGRVAGDSIRGERRMAQILRWFRRKLSQIKPSITLEPFAAGTLLSRVSDLHPVNEEAR